MSRFSIPFLKEGQASLRDLQDEMNSLLQRLWHAGIATGPLDGQDWAPLVDVIEQPERFVVRAEAPGLVAEDIDLSYCGQSLLIKGQKRSDYSDEEETGLIRRERRFGAFQRSIMLPVPIDADGVTASCKGGILEVVLPKVEASRPKSIKVNIS